MRYLSRGYSSLQKHARVSQQNTYSIKTHCIVTRMDKTAPWHPQTSGFLERSRKTFRTNLRGFVDKDDHQEGHVFMSCDFCSQHTGTFIDTTYTVRISFWKNIQIFRPCFYFLHEPEPQYNTTIIIIQILSELCRNRERQLVTI